MNDACKDCKNAQVCILVDECVGQETLTEVDKMELVKRCHVSEEALEATLKGAK